MKDLTTVYPKSDNGHFECDCCHFETPLSWQIQLGGFYFCSEECKLDFFAKGSR